MKTKFITSLRMKGSLIILFVILSLATQAQWANYTAGGGFSGETGSLWRAVGVGDFSPGPPPAARLHVSNLLLQQPLLPALNGFLFRTDGFSNVLNRWSLFTGTTNSLLLERFRLYVPGVAGTNDNVFLNATQPTGSMNFQTNSLTRMFIQNGIFPLTAGYVGIGNTNPQNTLEITSNTLSPRPAGLRFTNLTSTSATVFNPGPGVLSVDIFGDVIYVPGGGGGTSLCGGVIVDNVVKFTGGNTLCNTNITDLAPLSLNGINNTIPNDALDVAKGNVDVNGINDGYEINDQKVLWHMGQIMSLYGGVGAGTLAIPITPHNTYIGYNAGFSGSNGGKNTYIGSETGFQDVNGGENVFIGWRSGFNSLSSVHNTFVGNVSGFNNTFGSNNTFIGIGSGNGNVTGFDNISLGIGSGFSAPGLNNATAIGANATATQSNNLILANNTQNVGIGLSAIPIGPQNKLEINTTAGSPHFGSANGSSGLRFRNMTNVLSIPRPNPGPGVLSVDSLGNVIYVNSNAGAFASLCGGVIVDNVVKFTGGNTLCNTNITDLAPLSLNGINNTIPNDALDVAKGNVDVNGINDGYEINDQKVLWHQGNVINLYGGVGSGTLALPGTVHNAYYGYNSGNAGGGGGFNTFIGSEAGFLDAVGGENVFVGHKAGFNNVNGFHNTFLGTYSGLISNQGHSNVFVGMNSGLANVTGSGNISIGEGSGFGSPGLNNAAVVGYNAFVMQNDNMILANNTQNVGIGLSADPIGPQNKLEINTTLGSPYFGSANGSSGLRFRNMTSVISTPVANPGSGVLSVDNAGNVIYVNSGAGSSLGNLCVNPANPLTGDYTIPLSNNNFYFSDDNTNSDKVHIGFPCPGIGPAKLNVHTNVNSVIGGNQSIGIHSVTTYNNIFSINTGVYGEATPTAPATDGKGVHGVASASRFARGVYGQGQGVFGAQSFGGDFEAILPTSSLNYGVRAEAGNAQNANFGVWSRASGSAFSTGGYFVADLSTNRNIGVRSIATTTLNAIDNFGVKSEAVNSAILNLSNIGVLGDAINSGTVNDNIGVAGRAFNSGTIINTSTTALLLNNIGLYGEGDISAYLVGPSVTTVPPLVFSDQKIKTNVRKMDSCMELVMKLRPVNYDFNNTEFPELRLSKGKQYGFIAQEVKSVFPELVQNIKKPEFKDKEGVVTSKGGEYTAMNYFELIPILTKALQEQQASIDNQLKKIEELNQKVLQLIGVNEPTDNNNPDKAQLDVILSDQDVVVLNQNVPNPFAEQTVITYSIPHNTKSAQVLFYNTTGKLIKSVQIRENGQGKLNVFADDLSSGIYSYTLVINGKVVYTRKMEKMGGR